MFIERDLRELSNVSSHQFPDRSAKWLIRQRVHLEALLRMVGGEIADAFDFEHVEQLNRSFISDPRQGEYTESGDRQHGRIHH